MAGRAGVRSSLGVSAIVLAASLLLVAVLAPAGALPRGREGIPGADPATGYLITIETSPVDLEIVLDAAPYPAPHSFMCPSGSVHAVSTASPQSGGLAVRYVFDSWSDGGAQSHSFVCLGDTTIAALFLVEYYLTIDADIGATDPVSGWRSAGEAVMISYLPPAPQPDERVVFAGWIGAGAGSYTGMANPASIVMVGPITEHALAGREFRFVFDTSPSGLNLEFDGVHVVAPTSLWWAEGSSHVVGCPSPQPGYVFDRWDDGRTDNPRLFGNVSGPEERTCIFGPAPTPIAVGPRDLTVSRDMLPGPPARTGEAPGARIEIPPPASDPPCAGSWGSSAARRSGGSGSTRSRTWR